MKLPILALLALCATVSAQSAPAPSSAALSPGETVNGIYRNAEFGFTYRVPVGWVDRTEEMRKDSGDAAKSTVFLAVFEHPPEATTNDINSAVVIAAESVSSYPGLKNAAQYFGPLGEVTASRGLTAVNEPYEFPVDGKPVARRDYTKQMGSLSMHQSTLAMLSRGYVLSFTFIGSNDDEVQRLFEWLKIGNSAKSAKNSPKASQP
jgi:hypothetical protein